MSQEPDLKKVIKSYLTTQRLMSVATYGKSPWIANVYYVSDDDLHLYFISKTWREHSQALEKNSQVAVAIADSRQPIHKPQKGLQLSGTAKPVYSEEEIAQVFRRWNKLIAGAHGEKMSDPKKFLAAGLSRVYRITASRIKFFNTELWPKDQAKILEL